MPTNAPFEIGPYEVSATLSKTGSAAVLKAIDRRDQRLVALKLPSTRFRQDASAVAQLAKDLAAVSRLQHPNIVRLLDFKAEPEDVWVATELVEGPSLEALMKQGRQPLHRIFHIVKAVAAALEHAHARGLVHGHLKPRNVLLSRDLGEVKVADFGTARMLPTRAEGVTLTTGQVNVGAIRYLAPELAGGAKPDARSDLYALGSIFYELLTGRLPSGRISLPSQLVADLPSDLDPVILRTIAADPRHRYATVAELRAELEQLESDLNLRLLGELQGISRTTRRLFGFSPDGRGPGPALVVGSLAAALALLFGGYFLVRSVKGPAPVAPTASTPVPASPSSEPVAEVAALAPSPLPASAPSEAPPRPSPRRDGEPAATTASAAESLYQDARALLDARPADPEGARRKLVELLERHPGSPSELPALLLKAEIEERKKIWQRDPELGGSSPATLVTLRVLVERYPNDPAAEQALWKIAGLYEEAKRWELAAAALSELGSRFPSTRLDAWYRAGNLYERRVKDEARARDAYAKVPADSPNYGSAQEKVKKLGR
ncbi:MAG TPA: protein kinase [Thermoanaerobaculia bacterium]|nr:protein kinase [Thermoanaerobaculia bacterium]